MLILFMQYLAKSCGSAAICDTLSAVTGVQGIAKTSQMILQGHRVVPCLQEHYRHDLAHLAQPVKDDLAIIILLDADLLVVVQEVIHLLLVYLHQSRRDD